MDTTDGWVEASENACRPRVAPDCFPLIETELLAKMLSEYLRAHLALDFQLIRKDTKLSFYQRFSGNELPTLVGSDKGSVRSSTGEPGHLSFGPYLSLEPGNYIAAFYIRRSGPISGATLEMDVNEESIGQLAHVRLTDSELFTSIAGQVALQFTLTKAVDKVEVRIFVEADVFVEIHQLVVFSVEAGRWAA